MRKLSTLVLVLWIAGSEPLYAQEGLNLEDVEVSLGVLMGHVTAQLAELDECKREFPDNAKKFDDTKETYEALMSNDLDVVKRAFQKLYDTGDNRDVVEILYYLNWKKLIISGSEVVRSVNKMMNQMDPGVVQSNRHFPDDIQLSGNCTTVPPPRERYPL